MFIYLYLYLFMKGLSRDKSSHVQNSLWVYDISKNKWFVGTSSFFPYFVVEIFLEFQTITIFLID